MLGPMLLCPEVVAFGETLRAARGGQFLERWRWACLRGPELDDGLAHGEALQVAKVELVFAEFYDSGAGDGFSEVSEQLSVQLHQVLVIAVGLVELQHGELGIV